MSKKINKLILENNLEILEINRLYQVNQFVDRDTILFNSILDSEQSTILEKLSLEKIKLHWLDFMWLVAINKIEKEQNTQIKKMKMDSFIKVYKAKISELYSNSEVSIQNDIYTKTLKSKQDIIDSLINVGLKSEQKLNTLKLDIRINSNQFNKIIKNIKNGNTRNTRNV